MMSVDIWVLLASTLISGLCTAIPASLTVYFSFKQHQETNKHDAEQQKIQNTQEIESLKLRHQQELDELKINHDYKNQTSKLHESFSIAKQNRELMFKDLTTYLEKLNAYYEDRSSASFYALTEAESRILLFLGEDESQYLLDARRTLSTYIDDSHTVESESWTHYKFIVSKIAQYKSELGLTVYKD